MSELEKLSQTEVVQKELMKVSEEFPDKTKNEIISIVMDRLGFKDTQRPAVRRAKSQLIAKLDRFLEQMR